VIEARDLSFLHHGGEQPLANVSFSLPSGSILGLAGANGAGKSTLLALLAGIHAPHAGTILTDGSPADPKRLRGFSALVMQEADLAIIGSTVEEDLLLGVEEQRREEAMALAAGLGLGEMQRPVQTLSYGQKRKLSLATAMLRRPRLLLLDEPFAGLDYPGVREMRRLIARNREAGLTQVVALHDLALHDLEPLADLADNWLVLRAGRQEALGAAAEVFPRLKELDVRPPCSWQTGLGLRPWDWEG